jgi:hypothetical protein
MSIEQRLLELADETLRDARWKTEIRKIAEEVRIIEDRIKRLEREVELLRFYGNKDCTAQADEVLKKDCP